MNSSKGVLGKTSLILLGLAGVCLTHPTANAAGTEDNVPAPSQVFTPRTALAIYANLQGAGQSGIWKAIAEKAGPLAQQLQSLQGDRMASLKTATVVPGITETNVAEIAFAFEGEKVLNNIQSGQFDPDSAFIVAARLVGTPDVETLIQQVLAAIDKEKPGLRNQIEESRRRAGSATVFNIPAGVLGEHNLPFTCSFAVGPGKDGTIIGLGRSDSVQAFLSGRTEGKLRGQVNDTLSRRGQIWLYLPLPKDATKSLSGGGAEWSANPMLAGLAQSMDKVRDVSLSLKFSASQVDLALDLGCADGPAANQLAQGIQGFLGMMQAGAQQNAASVPPFVGKIRVRAEGAVFRFGTAFTIRDFDLAFQNVGRGVAATPPRGLSQTPKSEATPPPVTEATPVEVEFVQFSSDAQESLRSGKMRVRNRSSKPVKELRLTFIYSDQSGRRLGQWTRNHSGLTSDNLIGGEKTEVVDCLAFNVPVFTRKVTVTLHEVTFADGAKWNPGP